MQDQVVVSELEIEDEHHFMGRSLTFPPFANGHTVRLVFRDKQLRESIYPDLERTLASLGFDKVDGWDMLTTVAVGGTISLKGPRFQNQPCYNSRTIPTVFMLHERALVHALMTVVFNEQGNVSYGRSPTSFKEVTAGFGFNTETAFRKTTLIFRAVKRSRDDNPSRDDTYRVIIEGTGEDLCIHRFQFQPSRTWLCRRYPENRH